MSVPMNVKYTDENWNVTDQQPQINDEVSIKMKWSDVFLSQARLNAHWFSYRMQGAFSDIKEIRFKKAGEKLPS